ncbi:MAG TPA: Swt1 family HEPN domain-containing protein [Lacipirellulaceae bacterium]|nr:Swt1 family HEPN domain-containing protein [Lacipirellulaceae bacterium]HMP07766.1 Swt1 family HEPN domain-containing protein [Lacipirellulaceae bacterium]
MSTPSDLYSFVLRGDIARDSAERALGKADADHSELYDSFLQRLPFDLIDQDLVARARAMSVVYTAMAAFENAARKFISDRLLEEKGANWWEEAVSNKIRGDADKRKRDEEHHRYHGERGQSMISYCQLGDLTSIMQNNEAVFADYIPNIEWVRQIMRQVERSRNVIMHGGELSMNDIERVAMNIRDWLRQIGG